ncbi:hypothetical protein DFJ74DRAFT_729348 [Hyaloraphidium curvatum]|nr:hypothetical protein DFJ74DRAFT_729348 [Hyaloraphidium curvatum]
MARLRRWLLWPAAALALLGAGAIGGARMRDGCREALAAEVRRATVAGPEPPRTACGRAPAALPPDAALKAALEAAAAALLDAPADNGGGSPCALCFFGQLKNLNASHAANLADNVLAPLAARCGRLDAYLHTFALDSFDNPRNGERQARLDVAGSLRVLKDGLAAAGVRLLAASFSTREEALAGFRSLDYYLIRGDPWPTTGGRSMRNFLLQQHSLDRVSELWWPRRADYGAVTYLRPDLWYDTPLPVPDVAPRTLYAPDFDSYSGVNDRFAVGTPEVMDLYGHRMRLAELYLHHSVPSVVNESQGYYEGSLHAETFLKAVMNLKGIEVRPLQGFRFGRLRAGGKVQHGPAPPT